VKIREIGVVYIEYSQKDNPKNKKAVPKCRTAFSTYN
jgi:hypothetical protein